MLIVGERINSTRTSIKNAIISHNASVILREAETQISAGAQFIDINCASGTGNEAQDMDWMISVIQSQSKNVNICIDSPSYLAIDRALAVYKGRGSVMINSITGEESRIRNILPLAMKYKAKVIALTMDEKGMPSTAEERFEAAKNILERLKQEGLSAEDIYFDPLIRPVSTEPTQAREFLKSLPLIKSLGNVRTICGLSNVSFGLPNRSLMNSVFLSMAIEAGLDAALLDPLDKNIASALAASKVLLCEDEYCAGYIKAFREGILV